MAGVLAGRTWGAEAVTEKIDILELKKAGQVEYHINPSQDFADPAEEIFQIKDDGHLHISGRGYGYMVTKESYKDYHLVIEFKWGAKTWGKRADRTRDNGILVHSYGPHGAYGNTWMASIEAQIIEGGIGDILVLSPKLPDGTELITSVTAEFDLDRDKEKRWKKGAPRQEVTKGRINWEKRDEDWVDKLNFRGKDDPDSPVGEWNRMEVIAKGDTLQYFVNGRLVNEAFECKPAEGRICVQTEGAEMIVRRYELHPLGAFTEKWNPIQASGGSNIDVRHGQDKPLSPEESLAQIQLDGPYEAQLVASEPLIQDPVEITWDEQGRLFVAEMRDYPLGPPNPGDPWLSRVSLLTDEDGDGRMDKSIVFADNLDHVQGLLPYNGGLIATTRTQILFLKDTDGDGKADEIRPLIKGFNPRHSQLQVSSPRWGLDGCVHFNNGLDSKEIYPADDPNAVVNVPRANFKWDPRTGEITPTGGPGQYGGAFDDWGHHFYCSNRNPVMFTVMPWEAMRRNPHAGITQNHEDIAPPGADTRVFPLKITHTTADAHAGTNTACSGLGVYRGHLMPELKNNVFVPDPTGQLITRYQVEPNGASLKATRVGDRTEFFRSGDEWCRPVNFTTGPDGAIYVCDIYRRWIDHARFFPEEFVKNNDMREGENQGRIWRIVPRGTGILPVTSGPGILPGQVDAGKMPASHETGKMPVPPPIEPAPKDIEGLVAWLGHENAWQRETAQRLLVEDATPSHAEKVLQTIETHMPAVAKTTAGKINLMWTVVSLIGHLPEDKQKSTERRILAPLLTANEDPRVIENAIRISALGYAYLIDLNGRFITDGKSSNDLDNHPDDRVLMEYLCYHLTRFDDIDSAHAGDPAYLGKRLGDPWIQKAVASTYGLVLPGTSLFFMFSEDEIAAQINPKAEELVRLLARCSSSDGNRMMEFENAIRCLESKPGQLTWWKPALLQGLAEGFPKSGGKLGAKSLADFVAKPPQGFEDAAKEIGVLLAKVDEVIADPKAPLDQRLAVLPLLGQRKWEAVRPVVKELLGPGQPPPLAAGALALLRKFPASSTAPLIYELLPEAGPALKRDLVPLLTANTGTALELFKRMEKGEFPTAWVDVETRWKYQRNTGELGDLARKLFGEASSDRAAVVADYAECAQKLGDAERGRQIFALNCVACHKLGDVGVDVGPPLSDVRAKPPEALLSDILDPNRMFEARWSAYQIDTKDGRMLSGLVTAESETEVTLTMMGGIKEAVRRADIKVMKSLDRSLMPVGLEAALNKEQMADLLAFLLGK